MDKQRRREALDRFERATELPLLLLALAMVPLLVIPLLVDLSEPMEQAFLAADWFIWAVFAFEYLVRLVLTPERLRFIRREWPDLLIIVLPFLRPLRVMRSARALRLLRLGRLAVFLGELGQEGRRLFARHRLHYALLLTMLIVIGGAVLGLAVEEQAAEAKIQTFGDALWWAVATITTVGYGDVFPVTAAGRAVAAFLMMSGIAFFGVLTANIAAFFVEGEVEQDRRLDEVLERLKTVESNLTRLDTQPLVPKPDDTIR